MKKCDIWLRDPFVLPYHGKYYLYGSRGAESWSDKATGLDVYISDDLENWESPKEIFTRPKDFWATKHFWAPEVHEYRGSFYMLVTMEGEKEQRGVYILKASAPDGRFEPYSERITPGDWEAIDGTLYVSKTGKPYMIFSHEWTQVHDGEICMIRLSEDLTRAEGKAEIMFRASEAAWVESGNGIDFVTDGPYMQRISENELVMIWSSFGRGQTYSVAAARSSNGEIDGEWIPSAEPIFAEHGGHAMIFDTFDGRKMISMHCPNAQAKERPAFSELDINSLKNTKIVD